MWQPTYELGKGVLFNGALAPTAFAALELPAEPEQRYGSPSLDVTTVSDAASFSELTTASVTASVSYNSTVSASVSAEAKFLKDTAGSSTRVHLVASSSWTGKARQFKEGYEPRLSDKVGVYASCTLTTLNIQDRSAHHGHPTCMTCESRALISMRTDQVTAFMACYDALIGRLQTIVRDLLSRLSTIVAAKDRRYVIREKLMKSCQFVQYSSILFNFNHIVCEIVTSFSSSFLKACSLTMICKE